MFKKSMILLMLLVFHSAGILWAEEDLRDDTQKMRDSLSNDTLADFVKEPLKLASPDKNSVPAKQKIIKEEKKEAVKKKIEDAIPEANVELSAVKFGEIFQLKASFERDLGERFLVPGSIPSTDKLQLVGEPEQKTIAIKGQTERVIEEIIFNFLPLDLEDLETPEIILQSEQKHQIKIPEQRILLQEEPLPAQQVPQGTQNPQQQEQTQLMAGQSHYEFKVEDLRYRYAFYTFLALLGFLLFYWWLKKNNFFKELFEKEMQENVVVAPIVPKRPAGELALERLERLLAEKLLEESKITEFVSRLMDDVLRPYLEDRFSLHAPQQTTAELCKDLLSTSHQGLSVQSIRVILEQTDLIKFAKAAASQEMAHEMAVQVRTLIKETEEKPQAIEK